MTTTKHEGECCKRCAIVDRMIGYKGCATPSCPCHVAEPTGAGMREAHPKQSTELEEILREFDELCSKFKFVNARFRYYGKDRLRAAYQSGYTAGQAAAILPVEEYAAYKKGREDSQKEYQRKLADMLGLYDIFETREEDQNHSPPYGEERGRERERELSKRDRWTCK